MFRGRRRLLPILNPELQLKLPGYCVLLTLLLFTALAVQAYSSYGRLYQYAALISPENIRTAIQDETWLLILRSGVALLVYGVAVFVASILYTEKMVGPQVAFRRQVQALKRGDYGSRVGLRRGDAFGELARDLNELAEELGKRYDLDETAPR